MATAIWWIRRDLRLIDNQALARASKSADQIVPTFILDPNILNADTYCNARFAFMLDGLRTLDADLRRRGSYLVVRRGNPLDELTKLVEETDATGIFAEADYSPYARRRDHAVATRLPLKICRGLTVAHPTDIEKQTGGAYTVFTPYKKAWLKAVDLDNMLTIDSPKQIDTPCDIKTLDLPDEPTLLDTMSDFAAGEAEAQRRLARFSERAIYSYAGERNFPAVDSTSVLSPYLRFGMVSARVAVIIAHQAICSASDKAQRNGAETWLSELIWREFYQMILYHHPHVRGGCYRPKYDTIKWRNDEAEFEQWCQGKTGYPIVDAAMRQLLHSGWMHNRCRMIVASFLTKDLLINWQWGERWFMQHLLDGDHAANNGGWQWSAGTGTDAAPYFRIFNPTTQGEKFDPDGNYIRKWVLELADVPNKYIHDPSSMPTDIQQSSNCIIGEDYPQPIVNHKLARKRTLEAYRVVGEQGSGRSGETRSEGDFINNSPFAVHN